MDGAEISAAIQKLRDKLTETFGSEVEVYLFGSVARGTYEAASDIDLLVLVPFEPTNMIEEQIFDLAFDIELQCNVVFGIIVYSKQFWHSGISQVMPLFKNIAREGVAV